MSPNESAIESGIDIAVGGGKWEGGEAWNRCLACDLSHRFRLDWASFHCCGLDIVDARRFKHAHEVDV